MSKEYKVRRYRKIYNRRRSSRVTAGGVIIWVVVLAALIFLGITLYQPVHQFINGKIQLENTPSSDFLDPSLSSSESLPATEETETTEEMEEQRPAERKTAIGVPQAVLQNGEDLKAFLAEHPEADQAVVLLKDAEGKVLYQSDLEIVAQAASQTGTAFDAQQTVQAIRDSGKTPVARIHAFQDHTAPYQLREMMILYQDSSWMWLDNSLENGGKPWLNPYSSAAQNYIRQIVKEAVSMGFEKILLDSVQFPSVSLRAASFGTEAEGISRSQALQRFASALEEELSQEGIELFVVIGAASALQNADGLYEGNPLEVFTVPLYLDLSPSQFGVQFSGGGLELENAHRTPYEAVKQAGQALIGSVPDGISRAREWGVILQTGDDPVLGAVYQEQELADQQRAAEELGVRQYFYSAP